MANIFTLDSSIVTIASQAIDDLINQLGKACLLLYPPRAQACNNCIPDPVGRKSSNHWLSGGPMQFPDGSMCPLCNGVGQLMQQHTETITLLCAWEPSKFFVKLPASVQLPAGSIQTKGFMVDLPRVLKARSVIIETLIQPIQRYRFDLVGEPVDPGNIVQGRYFVANWKRNG